MVLAVVVPVCARGCNAVFDNGARGDGHEDMRKVLRFYSGGKCYGFKVGEIVTVLK